MARIDREDGQRQTQVVEQMDRLTGNVSALEDTSTELIKRLGPLLTPEPPEVETDKKDKVERDLVPHADNLRSFNRRLNKINTTLNNTISRLEL